MHHHLFIKMSEIFAQNIRRNSTCDYRDKKTVKYEQGKYYFSLEFNCESNYIEIIGSNIDCSVNKMDINVLDSSGPYIDDYCFRADVFINGIKRSELILTHKDFDDLMNNGKNSYILSKIICRCLNKNTYLTSCGSGEPSGSLRYRKVNVNSPHFK